MNAKAKGNNFLQEIKRILVFMPKLEYLKSKLSKKALIPRFYEENIAYLDLSHMDKVAFPMVCFCDIHLNKLTYHMGGSNSSDGYGRYGIGMSKTWGIQEGVQPISYMNSSSALLSDFKIAFKHAMEQMNDGTGDEILQNQLLTHLLFIKPLNGEMAKQRGTSFEHIASKNTEFFLQPRPFPSPYELEFSGNGHTRTLTMQRQPLADLNKTLIKNIDDDALQVSMTVIEDTETLQFFFNFNLQKVDTIDEVLSVLLVYQAFIQGDGQVIGMNLPSAPISDVEKETLNDLLTFWSKMSNVEKKLGVQFPLDLPLSDEEDIWLMKLYASFVKEEPFRENIKYTSISFDPPENIDKERLN